MCRYNGAPKEDTPSRNASGYQQSPSRSLVPHQDHHRHPDHLEMYQSISSRHLDRKTMIRHLVLHQDRRYYTMQLAKRTFRSRYVHTPVVTEHSEGPNRYCIRSSTTTTCPIRNSSAQSDQSLRCPHEEALRPWLSNERITKTLIRVRLGGCPG